jgi:sugar lactone lactonase YvrE
VGIEVGPDDTLYVVNCGSASITTIAPDGTASQLVQSTLLNCPNGITRAPDGTLYVANFQDGNVIAVPTDGEPRVHATLPGNNNGHLVYHDGALYVVARTAHQIYRVTLDGQATLFAGLGEKGGADGPATEAQFCFPNDLGFSPDGKILYVNDVADHTSEGRKLAPTRIRRVWIGS